MGQVVLLVVAAAWAAVSASPAAPFPAGEPSELLRARFPQPAVQPAARRADPRRRRPFDGPFPGALDAQSPCCRRSSGHPQRGAHQRRGQLTDGADVADDAPDPSRRPDAGGHACDPASTVPRASPDRRRHRQQPRRRGQAAPRQRAVPARADHRVCRVPGGHHRLQGEWCTCSPCRWSPSAATSTSSSRSTSSSSVSAPSTRRALPRRGNMLGRDGAGVDAGSSVRR